MEIQAITKARVLAWMELDSLTNGGRLRLADCIQPLVNKFDFQKFPSKPEDFDMDKGIQLESGLADGILIDCVTIFSGAIVVDTLASTDISKQICISLLEWARDELGASYEATSIRRWGYINDLVFKSSFPLLAKYSYPVTELARKTSLITENIFDLPYEPSQIWIGHDPMIRKHNIASFVIQHRAQTRFGENVFFSEAPLPTNLHIQYLEEFERDVIEMEK